MSFPRYPKYKDSGVEWLGEVPEHWEVRPIKKIVAVPITDGPHETPQFIDEGIPFVSAEAVSSGRIDFSKVRACISTEDNARYSLKYSPKRHDIYMVKSGATTGITAIVEDRTDFNIWSPLAVIRCGREAVPHFVLNFLRSRNFLEAVTLNWSFGTQQNIGMGVIENLSCTLPPPAEQTQIAAFLGRETAKIDELVAEQRRLMELLKEKRQAVISHAVTQGLNPDAPMKPSGIEWLGDMPAHWEVLVIKRFSTLQRGHDLTDAERTEGPYPVITSGGISGTHGSFMARGPGVVTGRYGSTGRLFYIEDDFWPHNTALYVSNFHGNCPRFVWYSLQTVDFAAHSAKAAVPGIDRNDIHVLPVAVPPKNEQAAIAVFLDSELAKLDTLTAEAQRAIDLLQERRSALISAAVTGQIDVRPH
ncbi:MAG: restriction endonuclease subunit S [Rhodocyclales bacterium]|nr:restriction endonuclease subunit S [Rhodocyclales bacterium]